MLDALVLPLIVLSGGVRPPSDSAAVVAVVESYHAAELRGDSLAMLRLLSEDAIIMESGGIETRDEFRAHHVAADIAFVRAVKTERGAMRVRVKGNAAWVSSTSTTTGEVNGRAVNSAGAELMVLAKERSDWKISVIHWSSRRRGT